MFHIKLGRRMLAPSLSLLVLISLTFIAPNAWATTHQPQHRQAAMLSQEAQVNRPQSPWSVTCQESTIELIGSAMEQQNPQLLAISDTASWSLIQMVGAGEEQAAPSTFTVTSRDGISTTLRYPTTLFKQAPLMNSPPIMGYRAEVPGVPGLVKAQVHEADASKPTAKGVIAYAIRPLDVYDPDRLQSGVVTTTFDYVWGGDNGQGAIGPAVLILTLPAPLPATMNIQVQVALMDTSIARDDDLRMVLLRAEAGGSAAEEVLSHSDLKREAIPIRTLVVEGVPEGTQEVRVTLESPLTPFGQSQWDNPNAGASVFLLGASVLHECPSSTPIAPPETTPATGTLVGKAYLEHHPTSANIEVDLVRNATIVSQTRTAASGVFTFTNVLPGDYQIRLKERLFLPAERPVRVVAAETTELGEIGLWAGDTLSDGRITLADWHLCAVGSIPVSDPLLDITEDGFTDVQDCSLVLENIGRSPLTNAPQQTAHAGARALMQQSAIKSNGVLLDQRHITLTREQSGALLLRTSGMNQNQPIRAIGMQARLVPGVSVQAIEPRGDFAQAYLQWHQDGTTLYIVAVLPERSEEENSKKKDNTASGNSDVLLIQTDVSVNAPLSLEMNAAHLLVTSEEETGTMRSTLYVPIVRH